jgi:hypothetical protein
MEDGKAGAWRVGCRKGKDRHTTGHEASVFQEAFLAYFVEYRLCLR